MSKPIEGRDHSEFEHGEEILQAKPFRHSIRVHWGDCDPARIAYTANISAWALRAIETWWEHYAGVDWYEINLDHNAGTPFVHMKLDFRSPVTPRHMLDCDVRLKRLGTRSITHEVKAYQNGTLCFEGEFVAVFVDPGHMKPRIPPAGIPPRLNRVYWKSDGCTGAKSPDGATNWRRSPHPVLLPLGEGTLELRSEHETPSLLPGGEGQDGEISPSSSRHRGAGLRVPPARVCSASVCKPQCS